MTGTLQVGKEADIIAVQGNPLTDIRSVARVEFVMLAGKIFKQPLATGAGIESLLLAGV